jgi:radial spoke head protein 9
MDAENFDTNLKYINLNGATLNIDERLNIKLALSQLQSDLKLDQVFFWGKISGTVKDYFIAYSLDYTRKTHGFPSKNFFWASSSNYIFASLPGPLEKFTSQFNELNVFFTGEHDRIVIEQPVSAPVVVDEDLVLPSKMVTELNRLSHVVHSIENNCAVVPRGSYKFTPLKETVRNEGFKGLNRDNAFALGSWQHFHPASQHDKVSIMQRDEAVYNNGFLDEIVADYPRSCWSLVRDCTESVANLRNNLWAGYYAFHRLNTPIYGSLYIGNGIRNNDLPFMV